MTPAEAAADLAASRAGEAAAAPPRPAAAGALRWWRNPRTGNYVATSAATGRAYLAGALDRRLARPWFVESWPDGQPDAATVSYGYKRLRDAQARAAEIESGARS